MKQIFFSSMLFITLLTLTGCGGGDVGSPPQTGAYVWPDATNTGPTGNLTLHTGNITTSYDGQIIENMEIHGNIDVSHDNVIIRNCEIYGQPGSYNVIYFNGMSTQTSKNLLVEHCHIYGNGAQGCGIYGKSYTIKYCNLQNMPQPVKVTNGTVVVEYNYIHDLWGVNAGMHNDGMITNGDADHTDNMNITVRNNYIYARTVDGNGGASGAILLWGDFGQVDNWLIEHNKLQVGEDESFYIFAGGAPGKPYPYCTNVRVLNNVFVYTSRVGRSNAIVYLENANGNYASGNIWEDTGAIVVPNPGGY